MSRKPEDFKIRIEKSSIKRWTIHNCSLCGYPCGFLFRGDKVFFDCGCYCVTTHEVRKSNLSEVCGHYNIQDSTEYIQKMDEFWGFNESI